MGSSTAIVFPPIGSLMPTNGTIYHGKHSARREDKKPAHKDLDNEAALVVPAEVDEIKEPKSCKSCRGL